LSSGTVLSPSVTTEIRSLLYGENSCPGKRVTFPAESTLASVYMSKMLTPFPYLRALAHVLIVSPAG